MRAPDTSESETSTPHDDRRATLAMRLKILIPTQVLLDEQVQCVTAHGENGSFCLLPRHVDFLSALQPGILTFTSTNGLERYVAVGDGILVKRGTVVRVSVRRAIRGSDLPSLKNTVSREFQQVDERERHARSAIAGLEADFVRRFLQLKERGHG